MSSKELKNVEKNEKGVRPNILVVAIDFVLAITFLGLSLFIDYIPNIENSVFPTKSMYTLIFAFIGMLFTFGLALYAFNNEIPSKDK